MFLLVYHGIMFIYITQLYNFRVKFAVDETHLCRSSFAVLPLLIASMWSCLSRHETLDAR